MAVFGAGNIGRGVIGQIFSQSGYDVVFIDAVESLVNELNAKGYYPLELVTNDETITYEIGPVSACLAQNQEQVNQIISKADAMATAVGVPVLPKIAPGLAAAFAARKASGNNSELDILVCENKLGAGDYLRSLILEINPDLKMMLENKIGFVETSSVEWYRYYPNKKEEKTGSLFAVNLTVNYQLTRQVYAELYLLSAILSLLHLLISTMSVSSSSTIWGML
jgi:hypothetical protein